VLCDFNAAGDFPGFGALSNELGIAQIRRPAVITMDAMQLPMPLILQIDQQP
jgi:hypothetical protein